MSRILNETVLREESVCRLCFNLLNDIDYHLKEAQEKTDEVTAKFIDKEKDPLKYNAYKAYDPRRHHEKKHRCKVVTTSGGRPKPTNIQSRTIQVDTTEEYNSFDDAMDTVERGRISHSPIKNQEQRSKENVQLETVHSYARAKDNKIKSPKKSHALLKGSICNRFLNISFSRFLL